MTVVFIELTLTIVLIPMTPDRIDFQTHYTYVSRLEKLARGVSLTCTLAPKASKADLARAQSKLKLIELTKQSIKDERKIVDFDEEYSSASVLWLPVKTYYLIYHVLSAIDFMLTGDPKSLSIKHGVLTDVFSDRLARAEIAFSEARFNTVFDRAVLKFTEQSGEHLRAAASDDLIHRLLMKKIANYKIENQKVSHGWNFRRSSDRAKRDKFIGKMKVSVFDYFYLMRIKSNYRGFHFIDDLPAQDTAKYFRAYFNTARHFYIACEKLRKALETQL